MKSLTLLLSLLISVSLFAQYEYEPTASNPYGKLNPEAPKQTADYEPIIGTCKCKSVARINQSTWADTVMMNWTFKYIMNGLAVQDMTLKEDGTHSGSIRQYNADSASWYVHYYASSTPTPTLSAWGGNKVENGNIVLYKEQKAPNGFDGYYRITFSDMTKKGFNWAGAWVSKDESIVYPTWRIYCLKME
ncbi:hypothetical protein [Ekhidna sp. To15]|uniref:hypothetical protein n=1 Tax=Ekhidna sp. To15 TaxID=3395267 RepID=UPI003F51E18B